MGRWKSLEKVSGKGLEVHRVDLKLFPMSSHIQNTHSLVFNTVHFATLPDDIGYQVLF